MTAQETIDDIRTRAMAELDAAASLDEIVAWERAFLGPKGELTLFLRGLASLAADQRPIAGRGGNALKTRAHGSLERSPRRARRRGSRAASRRRTPST